MLKYKKCIFKFDYELCIIKFKKYNFTKILPHLLPTQSTIALVQCGTPKKSPQNINHLKETRVLCWSIFLLVYGAIH